MNAGIYRILNTLTGKVYIGRSKDLESRKRQHFDALAQNEHINIKLQNSYNLYGPSVFVFEIIESYNDCDTSFLIEREQHWLDTLRPYDNGYNISTSATGGYGTMELKTADELMEIRKKISIHSKLKFMNEEFKERHRASILGFKFMYNASLDKEIRVRDRDVKRYELDGYTLGRKSFSESHIISIRNERKERFSKSENNTMYMKTHSAETRKKIGDAVRGKINSHQSKEKTKFRKQFDYYVDGVHYQTIKQICEKYHISNRTVTKRLDSDEYPNYIMKPKMQ